MSGWLLILALLALGGVLATLGDRLGSRVGKARLSLFNLRPRKTAVLITVLTGSLISAVSLGLMLAVSERLRVGLFELDALQARLLESRTTLRRSEQNLRLSRQEQARVEAALQRARRDREQTRRQLTAAEIQARQLRGELKPLQAQRMQLLAQRDRLNRDIRARDQEISKTETELARVRGLITAGETELKGLEEKLIALRRGDVVISSGQPLASAKVSPRNATEANTAVVALLRQANLNAFQRVLPAETPNRQILLVPRQDIATLESRISRGGPWVVSIRSAANVLRGEDQVLGFPDLRPNRQVLRRGDLMASTVLEGNERSSEQVRNRLNLLLAASFAKAQRQGSIADGVQFDVATFNRLGRELSERPPGQTVALEAVAVRDAETPDPLVIDLRLSEAPSETRLERQGPGRGQP
ncbi:MULTISPECIES: DUF3084 domain-containing protein [unclassified Synechococcus]|uniref:DUF3084 domain-containing protein n=1 Tax=unclassified Synechococcus TaxID=2626047 RepID=UPI0000698581|nr:MULTISPECIES: DUF3084 domain-containing protein [unclassified Synechococcus]EAQ75462.1 hypothetical protein WH5701_01400 [Synechococcus sp. WH 5701]WFN59836.1 DUF3084 domain-containing protein [Synechococcus sp. CCFWC 502]